MKHTVYDSGDKQNFVFDKRPLPVVYNGETYPTSQVNGYSQYPIIVAENKPKIILKQAENLYFVDQTNGNYSHKYGDPIFVGENVTGGGYSQSQIVIPIQTQFIGQPGIKTQSIAAKRMTVKTSVAKGLSIAAVILSETFLVIFIIAISSNYWEEGEEGRYRSHAGPGITWSRYNRGLWKRCAFPHHAPFECTWNYSWALAYIMACLAVYTVAIILNCVTIWVENYKRWLAIASMVAYGISALSTTAILIIYMKADRYRAHVAFAYWLAWSAVAASGVDTILMFLACLMFKNKRRQGAVIGRNGHAVNGTGNLK